MADTSPLIIQKLESGLMTAAPRPGPNAVFVLSYNDGGLKIFQRGLGFTDRAGSRWCYVVDVSQRFSSGELQIPARGDIYYFQAWFDAGWQVSDAEAIVRNNIEFGEPLVSGFLSDALWRKGRCFDPEDVQGAEEEILRSIRPPLVIGSGLTLTALTVRLALDTRQATRGDEVRNDVHVGRLERARVQRLRGLVDGDESFLMIHLAQHPGDTGAVLQMITQARERNDQLRLGLLDRMLEKGFIQDADIGPLRDSILGGGGMPALQPGSYTGPVHPNPALVQYPAPSPPPTSLSSGYLTQPVPDPHGPRDLLPTVQKPAAQASEETDSSPGNVAGWRSVKDRRPDRGTP
jgi:hypothetical protein